MSSTVTIWVISPDTRSERRFDLGLTVLQLKVAFFAITLRDPVQTLQVGSVDKARAYHRNPYQQSAHPVIR
jgi:hypothetical protein